MRPLKLILPYLSHGVRRKISYYGAVRIRYVRQLFPFGTALVLISCTILTTLKLVPKSNMLLPFHYLTIPDTSIEIFAAPPPLSKENIPQLRRAISSWQSLRPRPTVTLLGRDKGLGPFARRQHVLHDTNIDENFLGRPLFNSLISRANRSNADITVLINSDIILLDDFTKNLHKLSKTFDHFFAVGARYDLDVMPDKPMLGDEALRDHIRSLGSLHNYGGMDFWAWTTKGPRLVQNPIPPFVYARGRYDNWLMHEVVTHAARPVIDLSETVVSVHVRHRYNMSVPRQAVTLALASARVRQRAQQANSLTESTTSSNFWSRGKSSNFELFLNIHLSLSSGSYRDGLGTTRHAPWKMSSCHEPGEICLLKRSQPGVCFCEYSPQVPHAQVAPQRDGHGRPKTYSIMTKDDKSSDYPLPVHVTRESARNPHFGLPLTIFDALASVMQNGTVVISAVNFSYRFVMMNWVCHMRRLGIRNFIIVALDKELYRYAFSRGVAVYYENSFHKGMRSDQVELEGIYGSEQFQRLTKMKTRVVTRILRLGYDVIWSDCDVVFFKNPIPTLMKTPGDLIIQSNAPDGTPANGIRRINSGFYLARSSEKLINILDLVVEKALGSNLTEQPCFYDILCGEFGEFREGRTNCIRDGVSTVLLSRELFPNGITRKIWETRPGYIEHRFPQAFIVHNNWVSGLTTKIYRMRRHGFDMFNSDDNVCLFDRFGIPFERFEF